MRVQAVAIAWAQRQVASMRRRSCRAPRDDAGRDVQHPVAEGGDLAACQVGVIGEADEFGPGDQIGCRHDDFEPRSVGVKRVEG